MVFKNGVKSIQAAGYNCAGTVVGIKKNGAEFTHFYVPSLCKEVFVMRHNLGHSSTYAILEPPKTVKNKHNSINLNISFKV